MHKFFWSIFAVRLIELDSFIYIFFILVALRAGLVSRVVPEEKVDAECEKIANKICSLSRPIVALGKTFYYAQIGLDRQTAYRLSGLFVRWKVYLQIDYRDCFFRYAQKVMIENLKLVDSQEGLSSFVEKRHPKWGHTDRTVW